MNDLYLLDLDRTIFDTSRFGRDLAAALTAGFGVTNEAYMALLPKYVDQKTRAHDFYAHAQAITGATPEAIDAAIERQLADNTYVYADLAPWLAAREPHQSVAVVTVGYPSFQRLKFRYTPGTEDLPKIITAINKGVMLKNALTTNKTGHQLKFLDGVYRSISLADDKPDTFTALDGSVIRGYHLARPHEQYAPQATPKGVKRITKLEEYQ